MIGISAVLNAMSEDEARAALLRCCGSARFAETMTASRPYEDDAAVSAHAEAVEAGLTRVDWLEALAAHPRIGERKGASAWSQEEQSSAAVADPAAVRALAAGNARYEKRFGHVFLISASGLDAATIRHELERRLVNAPEVELEEAAREQRRITRIRLAKLVCQTGGNAGGKP